MMLSVSSLFYFLTVVVAATAIVSLVVVKSRFYCGYSSASIDEPSNTSNLSRNSTPWVDNYFFELEDVDNSSSEDYDYERTLMASDSDEWLDTFVLSDLIRVAKPVGDRFPAIIGLKNLQKLASLVEDWRKLRARRKLAAALASCIETNYLQKMGSKMPTLLTLSSITASCRLPKQDCYDSIILALSKLEYQPAAGCSFSKISCSGLGDRLRGTVIALYLAIATRRLFRVDWPWPSDIGDYFQLNHNLYGVPKELYERFLPAKSDNRYLARWMYHNHNVPNKPLTLALMDEHFVTTNEQFTSLFFLSNRFSGLDGIFANSAFLDILNETLPTLFDGKGKVDDYSLAISAALRSILSRPNEELLKLIKQIISKTVKLSFWKNAFKVGVQIRTEEIDGTNGLRVKQHHFACFSNETIETYQKTLPFLGLMRKKGFVVFVSTDWRVATSNVLSALKSKNLPNVRAFSSDDGDSQLSTVHIDKYEATENDVNSKENKTEWMKFAKTFVDWYLLTRMDYLIITRSGFSESAAHYSLKPTRRFLFQEETCTFEDYNKPMKSLQISSEVSLEDTL